MYVYHFAKNTVWLLVHILSYVFKCLKFQQAQKHYDCKCS